MEDEKMINFREECKKIHDNVELDWIIRRVMYRICTV